MFFFFILDSRTLVVNKSKGHLLFGKAYMTSDVVIAYSDILDINLANLPDPRLAYWSFVFLYIIRKELVNYNLKIISLISVKGHV